jgi:translation elongation factor EF-1beta
MPIVFGLKKLTIICYAVEQLLEIEELERELSEYDDVIQSVDLVSFNAF